MSKKGSVFGRFFMALVFIFLYAPIVVLIVFSFNAIKSRTVWGGFSLQWYVELFQDSLIMNSLYTTLAVSILSAVIATVVGTITAIGLSQMRKRWRSPLLAINNIPVMSADIVTGVSLCRMFVAAGQALKSIGINFTLGFGTLLIAHITFNIPYVILSVMPKIQQMDKNLVDAALDLGCSWFQAFWKVMLPELRPGIVNGVIIAFTMSIDDFMISYFTSGEGVQTLSMTIYSMARKRITPSINALSTILFVSVLVLLIIINVREIQQEERLKKQAKLAKK